MKLIAGVWYGERTEVLKARARSVVRITDGGRTPSRFRVTTDPRVDPRVDWAPHVGRLLIFAGIYQLLADRSGYEPVQAWIIGHDSEGGLISFISPDPRYDFDGQEGDFAIFEIETFRGFPLDNPAASDLRIAEVLVRKSQIIEEAVVGGGRKKTGRRRMKLRVRKKQEGRRRAQARTWMRRHKRQYERGFDMSVDCAYDLDLCEWCEVNGDKTFIPVWLTELAETFILE